MQRRRPVTIVVDKLLLSSSIPVIFAHTDCTRWIKRTTRRSSFIIVFAGIRALPVCVVFIAKCKRTARASDEE